MQIDNVMALAPQMDESNHSSGALAFPSREECVVPDLLARRAEETPDKNFVVFKDEEWSYSRAASEAWRYANALKALGVQFGQCVSAWLPTGPVTVGTWLGALSIGAVYSPINLSARGGFLEHILNLAESEVLIAHPDLVPRLASLNLKHLKCVVVVGDSDLPDLPFDTISLEEALDGAEPIRPVPDQPIEPWHDQLLIYTSGTTGPSKGVRASSAASWNYGKTWISPYVGEDDIYLVALPMFHMAGPGIAYSMLQIGGTIALVDGFSATGFWEEVRRYGATVTLIIHAMVTFLLDKDPEPDDRDNSLKLVFMGPLTRVKEFSDRFDLSVYTGFGMTEVPVPITSELNPTNEESCGRAVAPFELRLVDENDIPVPLGEPGELIVRHPLPWVINSGYKNMPEATANAWRNGWFHTGDQFIQDADGRFYFRDRIKDAIRRRGENISSFEVEKEILAHPTVKEVAVVAVPNPDVSEGTEDQEVRAVIVCEEGQDLDFVGLAAFLADRMPSHWVPRFIDVIDELPRTPSHKLKKEELRAQGLSEATWDRERAGIRYRREALK